MAKQVLLTGSYQYTEEQIHMIEKLGWKVTFVKNELEPIGVSADQFDANSAFKSSESLTVAPSSSFKSSVPSVLHNCIEPQYLA